MASSAIESMADLVGNLQASSIGRSFDISKREGCVEFSEWMVDTLVGLGVSVTLPDGHYVGPIKKDNP